MYGKKEGEGNCVEEKERRICVAQGEKKINVLCCNRMSIGSGARHTLVFNTTPTKIITTQRRTRHIYCVLNCVLAQR